jgi:hypothetical protein
VSWNTLTSTNGTHTLTAIARDTAGNTTTSAAITVTVNNTDSTPPTVSISAPLDGATVNGTIAISATASDNIGVVGVMFQVDGVDLTAEDQTSPYSVTWDTLSVPNGSHTLTAVARDASGNTTTSASVIVTASNASPGPFTQPVIWTSLVNTSVIGGVLRKTAGNNGVADAGALSTQTVLATGGYLEVAAARTTGLTYVGFGAGNSGTATGNIQFGFRQNNTTVQVRESNVLRTSTSVAAGDLLRITVANNVVTYSKNGVVFYTSTLTPTYPLFVDTSLLDLNAEIDHAKIALPGGSHPTQGGPADRQLVQRARAMTDAVDRALQGSADSAIRGRVALTSERLSVTAAGLESKMDDEALANWMVDLLAAVNEPVEAISLYARSHDQADVVFVGLAVHDGSQAAVDIEGWRRHESGGYVVVLSPLPPGVYDVVAYGHDSSGAPIQLGARRVVGR